MDSFSSMDDILNKLLDNNDSGHSDYNMDSEEFINKWDLILFTDGSCIGKKKSNKFGGSGVYIHSYKNSDWNSVKIIYKLIQEQVFIYDSSSEDKKIKVPGLSIYDDITKKYICEEEDCLKIGYNKRDDNHLYCGSHKKETDSVIMGYQTYSPTNIRAEGIAILLALKAILKYLNSDGKSSCSSIKSGIEEISDLSKDEIIDCGIYNMNNTDVVTKDLSKCMQEDNYRFMIVSDSKFWIDLISTWLNGWINKRTVIERKNIDIIVEINYVLTKIKSHEKKTTIFMNHVGGHSDKKIKEEELTFYQKGNVLSDKLATHASASALEKIAVLK